MPDGNEITAQAADGTIHVFPAGTDPSVIDGAMKKYVQSKAPQPSAAQRYATQRGIPLDVAERQIKSWGPAKQYGPADEPTSFGGKVWQQVKGGLDTGADMLGGTIDLGKQVAATSGPNEAADLLFNKGIKEPAQAEWEKAKQTKGSERLGHFLASVIPGVGPMAAQSGEQFGKRDVGGGLVSGLAALEAGRQMAKPSPGNVDPGAMGREVMNEGASKIKVLNDLHAHAIETQKHIAGVAEAVHQDAQQAMSSVSQAVDAAKPEGVFDKGDVSNRLKTAIGDTVSDTTQLPKSVQKLLPAAEKGAQAGPNIGGKVLDLSKPEDMSAYQKYKKSGAFTSEEIARYEGKSTGNMSFEDLKQARSDLGRQMQNLQGPAKSAASAAYKELSTMLREGARDAGQEPGWIDANARWKNYIDDFERSPVKKTLFGENASDIMEPLTGKSRTQVGQILQKYTPFGMDMDTISQEIARYGMGDTVMKLSKPGKMDLLLARLSPSAVALRQIGPRIMRNPNIFDAVAGEGFEPKSIPPSKIFPSQKIAAKASTKGNPIPQGNPTPFKGGINASGVEASIKPASELSSINSLSSELDTMRTKLRNAGDAPQGEKAALQKQIDEYQQRLDELRRKK